MMFNDVYFKIVFIIFAICAMHIKSRLTDEDIDRCCKHMKNGVSQSTVEGNLEELSKCFVDDASAASEYDVFVKQYYSGNPNSAEDNLLKDCFVRLASSYAIVLREVDENEFVLFLFEM